MNVRGAPTHRTFNKKYRENQAWQHTPVVPTTQKARSGGFFEPRSSRPVQGTDQDSISLKENTFGRRERDTRIERPSCLAVQAAPLEKSMLCRGHLRPSVSNLVFISSFKDDQALEK